MGEVADARYGGGRAIRERPASQRRKPTEPRVVGSPHHTRGERMYYADHARHLISVPAHRTELLHMADTLAIPRHWYHAGRLLHIDIPQRDVPRVLADPRVAVVSSRELVRLARG